MDIKQLKLNGVPFYPKVGVDSIVNADGTASAVDTVVTQGSQNLVTSDAVYDAVNDIEHTPHWSDIQDKPNFATVATSGDYDDLLNKPAIPSQIIVDAQLDANSENPVQNKVINGYVVGLTNSVAGKAAAVKVGDDRYDSTDGVVSLPVYPSVKKFACDDTNKCDISGTGDVAFSGDGIVNTAHPSPNVLAISLSNLFVTTVEGKQDALVSGTNIKTINGNSILGSGNLVIEGGSGSVNSVSYSNNAGDFAPDANGVVTLTIDQTLDENSGRPVTNAATASAIKEMSTDITNLQTASANHSSAISALDSSVSSISSNVSTMSGQIDTLNNTTAGLLDDVDDLETAVSGKQATLVSGSNIKTINGNSLLGSGNINIGGGSSAVQLTTTPTGFKTYTYDGNTFNYFVLQFYFSENNIDRCKFPIDVTVSIFTPRDRYTGGMCKFSFVAGAVPTGQAASEHPYFGYKNIYNSMVDGIASAKISIGGYNVNCATPGPNVGPVPNTIYIPIGFNTDIDENSIIVLNIDGIDSASNIYLSKSTYSIDSATSELNTIGKQLFPSN